MRNITRSIVAVAGVLMLAAGVAHAKQTRKEMDPAMKAKMEKVQQLASPGEDHNVLKQLEGDWNYTMEMKMAPDAPAETMAGTSKNTLIYGGRFLKQEVKGKSASMPDFQGHGYIGYDNIRKQYQTVWLGNMNTGVYTGTGHYDPATKTLTESGEASCPMTEDPRMETRADLKIIDNDHMTYEAYSKDPNGNEYKHMEIQYTRSK